MPRLQSITALALAAVVTAAAAHAQAKDPVIGTWALNVAKSKFNLGPAPKSQLRGYVKSGDKIDATFTGVNADGKPMKIEFSSAYDGKDYAYVGDPNADAISFKRIDAYTVEATVKKGGTVMYHATRVISKDGKIMTVTQAGKDANGKDSKNVLVFDKK